MKKIGVLPLVFAAALSFACNTDKPRTSEDATVGTTGTTISAGDRDFVEDLTIAGKTEVELGNIAKERAASSEVKQFGEMMVRDHSKAGEALKQVAMQYAIPQPAGLDKPHTDLKNKLSGLTGAEFDREYMRAMVEGHENVVDRLQTRASEDRIGENKGQVKPESSDNPVEAALNQWAANALPTTRHHLDEAKRINERLGRTLTQR
jgi:putative membrane protein